MPIGIRLERKNASESRAPEASNGNQWSESMGLGPDASMDGEGHAGSATSRATPRGASPSGTVASTSRFGQGKTSEPPRPVSPRQTESPIWQMAVSLSGTACGDIRSDP